MKNLKLFFLFLLALASAEKSYASFWEILCCCINTPSPKNNVRDNTSNEPIADDNLSNTDQAIKNSNDHSLKAVALSNNLANSSLPLKNQGCLDYHSNDHDLKAVALTNDLAHSSPSLKAARFSGQGNKTDLRPQQKNFLARRESSVLLKVYAGDVPINNLEDGDITIENITPQSEENTPNAASIHNMSPAANDSVRKDNVHNTLDTRSTTTPTANNSILNNFNINVQNALFNQDGNNFNHHANNNLIRHTYVNSPPIRTLQPNNDPRIGRRHSVINFDHVSSRQQNVQSERVIFGSITPASSQVLDLDNRYAHNNMPHCNNQNDFE